MVGEWSRAEKIFRKTVGWAVGIRNKPLIAESKKSLDGLLNEKRLLNKSSSLFKEVLRLYANLDNKYGRCDTLVLL